MGGHKWPVYVLIFTRLRREFTRPPVALCHAGRAYRRMGELALICVPMLLAFGCGYWVRDIISRRRRAEARRIYSVDGD
jgi:hypothetical protein